MQQHAALRSRIAVETASSPSIPRSSLPPSSTPRGRWGLTEDPRRYKNGDALPLRPRRPSRRLQDAAHRHPHGRGQSFLAESTVQTALDELGAASIWPRAPRPSSTPWRLSRSSPRSRERPHPRHRLRASRLPPRAPAAARSRRPICGRCTQSDAAGGRLASRCTVAATFARGATPAPAQHQVFDYVNCIHSSRAELCSSDV